MPADPPTRPPGHRGVRGGQRKVSAHAHEHRGPTVAHRLLIPKDVYLQIDPADHSRWGIEHTEVKHTLGAPPEAAADLATVATSAVDAVFSFLDQLCWMITFEGVKDKTEVLDKAESFTIPRLSPALLPTIRRLIGFPTTGSDALGTQYGQIDTTARPTWTPFDR